MNKKGVELTMQTVVIALLVLLVLGVLIFLLFGGATSFNNGTKCDQANCIGSNDPCEGYLSPMKCDTGQKCCIPVAK
jgi:hypothetical protein